MKQRKQRTRTALHRRLSCLALGVWLVICLLLTWAVAADMRIQMKEQVNDLAFFRLSRENGSEPSLPGAQEREMIEWLGWPYHYLGPERMAPFASPYPTYSGVSSKDWLWGKWELLYGFEAAVIYYDEAGQEMFRTGDYLTFMYTREENWHNQNPEPVGYGYLDLEAIPGGSEIFGRLLDDSPFGAIGTGMLLPLFRITGYFEDNQLIPATIERGDYYGMNAREDDITALCRLDDRGLVEWQEMLTADVPAEQELTTIYCFNPDGYNTTPKSVRSGGRRFDSLADLLHGDYLSDDPYGLEMDSYWESVLITRYLQEDAYGSYTTAVAVRFHPLMYAVVRLIPSYLLFLGIILLLLHKADKSISAALTTPLENLSYAIRCATPNTPSADWKELSEIEGHYVQTYHTLAQNKAEHQQLRTALDYAHDAEEKRKALISNITHELKTPLAIIHSYTECLQEEVAPEKREQYLATILEETERMDGLVLQMLELSRLEAGKVRLATDTFSLLGLTRSIAERMQPLLEQRELTLLYDLAEDFSITADEGRIAQAITNLLSNAQKYTTSGGQVRLRIYQNQKKAWFLMDNTAPHLSEEALNRVWDSFYRGDVSRNTPGVGLGLPLVKSIVSLHGGTVVSCNTMMNEAESGVQFGFILPMT